MRTVYAYVAVSVSPLPYRNLPDASCVPNLYEIVQNFCVQFTCFLIKLLAKLKQPSVAAYRVKVITSPAERLQLAKYCGECVCLSVCEDISGTTRDLYQIFVHVAFVRGSVLLRHVYDRLHRLSAGRLSSPLTMHYSALAAKGINRSPVTSCSTRDHSVATALAENGIRSCHAHSARLFRPRRPCSYLAKSRAQRGCLAVTSSPPDSALTR